MNTHDKIELPEHDCLYESTNEQGYIDLEPAYRKSTVLRQLEADRQRRGEPVAWIQRSYLNLIRESNTALHNVVVRGSILDGDGDVVPLFTAPQPAEPVSQHPDDAAVDAFAAAMKAKLAKKRAEGRGNWQLCTSTYLSRLLREHVEKGDPVDVANLAMMLHQNGQRIEPNEPVKVPTRACTLRLDLQADTPEAMETALRNIGLRVLMGEMTTGCSGGYDSGYSYVYEQRDGPSHDEYVRQLNTYLARSKGAQ